MAVLIALKTRRKYPPGGEAAGGVVLEDERRAASMFVNPSYRPNEAGAPTGYSTPTPPTPQGYSVPHAHSTAQDRRGTYVTVESSKSNTLSSTDARANYMLVGNNTLPGKGSFAHHMYAPVDATSESFYSTPENPQAVGMYSTPNHAGGQYTALQTGEGHSGTMSKGGQEYSRLAKGSTGVGSAMMDMENEESFPVYSRLSLGAKPVLRAAPGEYSHIPTKQGVYDRVGNSAYDHINPKEAKATLRRGVNLSGDGTSGYEDV